MKSGDVIELIEDTSFYKKGRRATIVDMLGNSKSFEIIYVGEHEIDIMPKSMFKLCEQTD